MADGPDKHGGDAEGRQQHHARLRDGTDVNPRATGGGIEGNPGDRRVGDGGGCGGPIVQLGVERFVQIEVQSGNATGTPNNRRRGIDNGTTGEALGSRERPVRRGDKRVGIEDFAGRPAPRGSVEKQFAAEAGRAGEELKLIYLRQRGRSREEQGAKKKECNISFESHKRVWRKSSHHTYWHSL